MTIRAKLGLVGGTRDNPSQFVTVFDNTDSALDYQAALDAAVDAAPATIFGAMPDVSGISVEERKASTIRFVVPYTRRGQNMLLRSASARTRGKKIFHFLAAGNVYGEGGADITTDHPSWKWKPFRSTNAIEFGAAQPLEVDPLSETRSITYRTRSPFITDTYLDSVESMVSEGAFNDSDFWGREPYTLQLVAFNLSEREDGDWELSYGFGYRPTRTNLDVGDGVQIPTLRGCDFHWPIETPILSFSDLGTKVTGVVVGQIWPTANFADLKLPWQGSLTTRTTGGSGVVTTFYDHDIVIGNTVYLFWNGGYMQATCSAKTSRSVTFYSGIGDSLPIANTNLCITKNT